MNGAPRTPSPGGARAGGQTELPDWDRLRLSLHNVIGELLHSWGLLAAFRRRHAGRPASAARSPGAAPATSPPHRRGRREHIEMASFSYRVAPSSPAPAPAAAGRALCRVSSSPVVSSLADRRQQWREVSDTDSGVCVDRDSTVGSTNGVTVWEEFDGSGTGEGHRFSPTVLDTPSWCDCCGDLLWSDTVVCRYCSYTCHQRCRDLVTLDCPSDTSSELDLSEVTDPNQDEDLVEVQTLVRCDNVAVAEVRETDSRLKAEMIEKYNATSHGLYMTLSEDGQSFHGFIRVHMNLFRPINIVAGARPPSIYDVLQPEQTLERTLASFYLPRDTVKALHIDNDTTVQEVISSLLKKFKIVDDPRKFALYERLTEQGESTKVKMRRLADSERPLELALSWSHHGVVNKKFVLQENDTGDILWDNFTLPELNNFLTMLNKEEEDYKRRVRQKYTEMKRRIAEQMDQLRPPGGAQTAAAARVE